MPGNPFKYWSPDIARNNSNQDYSNMLNATSFRDYQVDPLPKYDYFSKAQDYGSQAANTYAQSAYNSIKNAMGTQFNETDTGSGRLGAVLRALRAQESGGNYQASNPSGALGAYQILGSNFVGSGGWDREALNRDISRQQFMSNPGLQNAIARYKFGQYVKRYGVRGALAAWYSGQPNWRNDASQNGGPSIHDYVMQVLSRM